MCDSMPRVQDGGTKQWQQWFPDIDCIRLALFSICLDLVLANYKEALTSYYDSLNLSNICYCWRFFVFEKFENLEVWDPNLKVSSSKLLGSQGLGVSEVGRSGFVLPCIHFC
jgi:hypothetical protein